jgi:hypothetical protein
VRIEQIVARYLGLGREFGEGAARGIVLSRIGMDAHGFIGERRRACARGHAIAAAGDEGIGKQAEEHVHRIESGLLRSGAQLTRHLRQAGRRQRTERQRNAAGRVEEIGQHIGDVLLVDVETAGRIKIQREIQVNIVGIITQAGREVRHIDADQRIEGAGDAAGGVEDDVFARGMVPASRTARLTVAPPGAATP